MKTGAELRCVISDLCNQVRDRDSLLENSLIALQQTEGYLSIEVNEAYGRDAHISTIDKWKDMLDYHRKCILDIKEILK